MRIPDESRMEWKQVISGQKVLSFEYLATKILLGRLTLAYKFDSSPTAVQKSVSEFRAFFSNGIAQPKIQSDLKQIFGNEVL